MVSYTYDAWGKPISKAGTLASTLGTIQPFRYRAYVYDEETGLYYINARYLEPIKSRFISSDTIDAVSLSLTSLAERNLYSYCDNNPIVRKDENGKFWHTLVGGVVGAVVSAAVQVVSNLTDGNADNKWYDGVGGALVTGAISGGLAASGIGLGASVAANAALSAANSAVYDIASGDGINLTDVLIDGCIGAVAGLAGGSGMGKTVKLKFLNRNLTMKFATHSWKTFAKGVKYYASQTKTLFKANLFPAIDKAAAAVFGCNLVNNHVLKRSQPVMIE